MENHAAFEIGKNLKGRALFQLAVDQPVYEEGAFSGPFVEYREPREYWVCMAESIYHIMRNPPTGDHGWTEVVHVREVIE